jgi:hypothetical protein
MNLDAISVASGSITAALNEVSQIEQKLQRPQRVSGPGVAFQRSDRIVSRDR